MIGADVRGRPFAANMLLAGVEGQAECAASVAIARLSNQPAGHLAHVGHSRRHKADAGAAELEGQPEALTLADGDIDAEIARCPEQPQRYSLGSCGDSESARAMR